MAGVWMTPCKNGQCELSVRRDGINEIVIATQTPLTDGQVEGLVWCIGAMQRSGKTLKDLLKENDAIEPEWIKGTPFCGNCGHRLEKKSRYTDGIKCAKCGQAVKWDG